MTLSHVQQHILLWYLVNHSINAFNRLNAHFNSIDEMLAAQSIPQWKPLGLHASHIQRFEDWHSKPEQQHITTQFIQMHDQYADHIVLKQDEDYPLQLKQLNDAPPILFIKGSLTTLQQPQVALVGSRKSSPEGRKAAFNFSGYLAEQGFWITSGLAYGIDAAAHQGALDRGQTIAVIATGLNRCYPEQHHQLQNQILACGGAIVSEFLLDTAPTQYHFPRRNRLVSGLSLGVLVVEAGLKSGSLITAQYAAEQGKQVFALPGSIHDELHQGCHQLIREGASLVDHPQQIVEDLALARHWQQPVTQSMQHTTHQSTPSPQSRPTFSPTVADIPIHCQTLYNSLDEHGTSVDQLCTQTQMTIPELMSQLMELELSGFIYQQGALYVKYQTRS